MLSRFIFALTAVLLATVAVQAQPWPAKNEQAGKTLESLLTAGVDAAALKKTTDKKSGTVLWKIPDPAKLAVALKSSKPMLTDAVTDMVALRWRDEPANRPFWTAYLRSLASATERPRDQGFADLFEGVANSWDARTADKTVKHFTNARDHFQEAKDLAWTAAAETELGNIALEMRKYTEADAAYARAVDLYTRALGGKSSLAASVIRNRGNVFNRQGNYKEAIKFYRESIERLGGDDGPNASEVAGVLLNLANSYISNKDAPAAKEAVERGIAIIQKTNEEGSPLQLPFLEALAQVYFSRYEHASARDVCQRALVIARKAYGEKSIDTVPLMTRLADHERALGQAKAALKLDQDALAILELQMDPDETGIADVRASLAEDYEGLAKLEDAHMEYQKALNLYRKGTTRNDKIGEISVLSKLADLAQRQGQSAESKSKYRDAIAAAARTLGPTHPFLRNLKGKLAVQHLADGAYGEAIAEYRSARSLIDRSVSEMEWAEVTEKLALALELADDLLEAEREVKEAITIFRREQHPNLVGAYLTLASIHRKRDELEESARIHQLALGISLKVFGAEHDTTMSVRTMVAIDERAAGKFADAEKSYRALAEIKKGRYGAEHPEYLKLLGRVAEVQAESGKLPQAIETYGNIVKIQRASAGFPIPERVDTLREFGRVLADHGKLDEALSHLNEARKLLVDNAAMDNLLYADLLYRLGNLADARNDRKAAELHFTESIATHRKLKTLGTAPALLTIKHLASSRADSGDVPGALKWIEEGLSALATDQTKSVVAWKDSPQTVGFLTFKAEMLLRSSQSIPTLKSAYRLLVTAGEITDRLRVVERSTSEAKASLIGREQFESILLRMVICEQLATAEPTGGWTGAAFRAAEEGRARVFLEQLGRSRSNVAGGLPPELTDRERKNAEELKRLRREMEKVEAAPFDKRDPNRIAALQKALNEANRTADEIESVIIRDYPRVAALRRPSPCSVAEARAVLEKNETAIVFCCGRAVSYALVLQPTNMPGDGLSLIPLPGMKEFEDDLEVLLSENNLKVPSLYRKKAALLYRTLIAPLEGVLGDRDLLIVPDGKLGLLAFESLIDSKGRFLVESRTIRMAPSLTALHLNQLWEKQRPRPSRTILTLGDPITSPTDERLDGKPLAPAARRLSQRTGEQFDRLVFSGREAKDVADLFRATADDRWIGVNASEGRLKAWDQSGRLAEYRYLHFATHGILGAGPEFPPALVLSLHGSPDTMADDGFLDVGEVSRLRLNADLVVLSACRSAHGDLRTAEGITGLARGFLIAGTRSVVSSLWTVDDGETSAMMVDIYRQIERGVPPATAIRNTKLRLIREGKHPYDWAPFILIGAK